MRRKLEDDEDDADAFENGLLRDQRRMRVPMRLMDSKQSTRRTRVVDDKGNCGLGLHRPGFRVETGGTHNDALVRDGARDEIQRAHDEYRQDLENAWRDPLADDGRHGQREQRERDPYAAYDAWIEQQWRTL